MSTLLRRRISAVSASDSRWTAPLLSYWRRRRTRSRSSAMLASWSSSEQARMIGSTESSGTPRRNATSRSAAASSPARTAAAVLKSHCRRDAKTRPSCSSRTSISDAESSSVSVARPSVAVAGMGVRTSRRVMGRARRLRDHPRRHGVIGGFVDEDEGAGGVAGGVRVGRDVAAEPQPDAPDVVEAQLIRGGPLERLELDPALDRLEARGDRAGAVLEQVAASLDRGKVAEPAERGAQLAHRRGRVLGGRDQLAAREVDLVLEADRHAQRRLDDLGAAVGVAHL